MTNVDQFSWYHGLLTRNQAESILNGRPSGTYLVRDSSSIPGDYVLSVSESSKVSHYIINNKGNVYQIGEQTFPDLPAIINFYKKHFLDTTTLKDPVVREIANEKVKALYNFTGQDPEDLGFKKGDILTVIKKEEENWWRVRDAEGHEGMIPRPYVVTISHTESSNAARPLGESSKLSSGRQSQRFSEGYNNPAGKPVVVPFTQTKEEDEEWNCHCMAIMDYIHPYDETRLTFKKGDRIKVLRKEDDGTWFGELNNRTGYFPFIYVQVVTSGASWNGV